MFEKNFVFLIATILAIGNFCLCGAQLDNRTAYHLNHGGGYNKADLPKYPGELCNRECKQGHHRICYFKFVLEHYQAMGVACGKCSQGVEKDCNHPECIVGDGFEKGVMSINRQIPGPSIQVCKDDLIVIDVQNKAAGTAATIHWHGIHQRQTPFMDGMPFLTQCPIVFGNSFRYQFKATEPGTQFYHSHAGHHKTNGQYGVLTVRQPIELEPLSSLYDCDLPEHHIYIADWMHTYAEFLTPGLPSFFVRPDSVHISGRGVYTNPQTFERTKVIPRIYKVTRGKRYRFRLVNGVSHTCPFQMQIENHNFTIIASDSFNLMPRTFDTLISNAGERYDFILEADKEIKDYWIRIKGLGVCTSNYIESYALIRYVNEELESDADYVDKVDDLPLPPFPHYNNPLPSYAVLNHPNATCWDGDSNQCISELSAYEGDDDLRYSKPDHKFYLSFNNYLVSNKEIFDSGKYLHFQNLNSNLTTVGAINKLSLTLPAYSLLTQSASIDESQFCDENNRPDDCNASGICHCVHRLKVKKDSIVELIIVDETAAVGRINHPFHLHGNKFLVIGMGLHPLGLPMTKQRAVQMEDNKLLVRNNDNIRPPWKDTVSIPSRGYVVVRMRASNPGFWLIHCHYEWHLSIGMGLILQVGEPSEMVKAPIDFPKCGNYHPSVKNLRPYQISN